MQLEVSQYGEDQKITLAPKGVINTETVSVLNDALGGLDYDGLDLTLDFSGLTYITSAGLRTLLITRKKLSEDTMRIVNMNEAVREVFEVSGFLNYIPVVSLSSEQPFPEDPSYRNLLSYRVKHNPNHKILHCDEKSYTWREIDEASQIAAKDLSGLGVRRGTHVGMFARNTFNWIAAFFAAQKLGAIVVLLNHSLKPVEIKAYSGYGDITHLCYDRASAKMDGEAFREALTGADSRIRELYDISAGVDFLSREGELEALSGRFSEEYDPDAPCIMIFTSGTTGRPKGVLSSAHDRLVNSRIMNRELKPTAEDRICLFLPLCHVFGISSGLNSMVLYDSPVYMPSDTSDASLLHTIEKNGCTLFNSVPTKILSLARSAEFDTKRVATLRASIIAGAAITEPQILQLREKMPHVHLISLYGMSEISPVSTTKYEDTLQHIARTVGQAVEGVEVEIRDHATGQEKPLGEEGELFVRSATSLVCYYKMELEKQAIDDEGWIATGDLGFLDEEGYIHFTGRCKDLIIRGGENISPREIEEAISQVDGIHDVKVVGVPDEIYGEIVAAAVVMAPGSAFSREETESRILTRIAKFKAPEYYVLYDGFPLLANGKIDMVNLKKDVAKRRENA